MEKNKQMINPNELIEFFEAEYCQEEEANEQKKRVSEELASYAENINISPKTIKTAFSLYKKYRSGKNTETECTEYLEMSNIIEEYFSKGNIE